VPDVVPSRITTEAGPDTPLSGGRAFPDAPVNLGQWWPAIVVAALLAVAAFVRIDGVLDDRTWFDENYVVMESNGVRFYTPWPLQFTRSAVGLDPTLGQMLATLAQYDSYPPLVQITVFALRVVPNQILAVRGLFLVLGLALIPIVCWGLRSVMPVRWAAVVAVAVVVSPLVTSTNQQIKWYTFAVVLGTVAGLLVLRLERDMRWWWALYAGAMALLVHTHYFLTLLVPAHALLVLGWRRRVLQPFVLSMIIVTILALPWFLWAFPRQQALVDWFNTMVLPTMVHNAWTQPLTVGSAAVAYGYATLALVGLQPSLVASRYGLPLLAGAAWLLFAAARSKDRRERELVALALLGVGVSVIGHTAMAVRLHNVIPLKAEYFVTWVPLVLAALVVGVRQLRSPALRAGALGVLLGVGAVNTLSFEKPIDQLSENSLSHYRAVTGWLERFPERETALVYRRDRDAKMMNLFYRGDMLQVIQVCPQTPVWCIAPAIPLAPPSEITRLVYVSSVRESGTAPAVGWGRPEVVAVVGETRIELAVREQEPTSGVRERRDGKE